MSKYSFIAVLLAVVIGAGVTSLIFSKHTENVQKMYDAKNKKLEHTRDSLVEMVKGRDLHILKLEQHYKVDSVKIQNLLVKIKQDGVRVEQKRKEVQNLSSDEKVNYILSRYKH